MLIENPESLQTWLTSYLEPLCDADPQALAQYVMALIGKDKPTNDLKQILSEQLEVFLQKETVPFVEVLFDMLDNKSYFDSVNSISHNQSPDRSPKGFDSDDRLQSIVDNNYDFHGNLDSPLQSLSPEYEQEALRSRQSSSFSQPRHRPRDVDMRRPENYSLSNFTDELNCQITWNDESSRTMRHQYGTSSNSSSQHDGDYRQNQQQTNRRSRSRSKSLTPSRSRSRSYSPRPSQSPRHDRGRTKGKSRSDNRSRNRVQSTSRSPSDGPVSKRTRVSSKSPVKEEIEEIEIENEEKPLLIKERCRDYDERGFCIRGDLCQFDHGSDTVILDGAASSVVFGLTTNGLPTANPGSANFLNEPYNPEAPGIDNQIKPHVNRRLSVVGSIATAHNEPSIEDNYNPIPEQTYWRPIAPPLRSLNPPPTSSSILTSTIGNVIINTNSRRNNKKSKRGNNSRRGGANGHRNNFHVGYVNRKINNTISDRCTLEVRKIPPNLNTIANLNSHFAKFGPIVNLQVGYDGDPRAALIKFVRHNNALAARRSTKAIFNNRFIKVFWYPSNQIQTAQQQQQSQSFSPLNSSSLNQGPGQYFHYQHQQNHLNHDHNHHHTHSPSYDYNNPQYFQSNEYADYNNEFVFAKSNIKDRLGFRYGNDFEHNMTISSNTSGCLSRTVHNPAHMRSHYSSVDNNTTIANEKPKTYMPSFITNNSTVKPELNGEGFGVASFNSQSTVPVAQPVIIKSKEDIKRDKILTKLDLQKKRQHILVSCMQEQKLLIEKLEKAKTDKEKTEIRSTIETFAQKITKLESEIKQDTQIILTEIAELPSSIRKNKIQVEKELLDVEMDFYNELHAGATASELHKKLQELKLKAKALCMNDLQSTKNMIKRFAKMRIALRDRNRLANHTLAKNFENLRKVDRRTRKIFIEGVTADDNNLLLSHLSQSAEIESLETTHRGVMVTFKTRRDAEMALPLISTVKLKGGTPLKASWFDETVLCSSLLCYISFLCPN